MCPVIKYTLLAGVLCSAPLAASTLDISITPFQKAQGILSDRNLRFIQTESLVADAQNNSTHILIHGLLPMDPAKPAVVTSEYDGIVIGTGAETDRGYVTLELPAGSQNANTATSPIVGIVQRAGAWSSRTLTPVASTLGEAAGESSFTASTITFNLTKGGKTVTGTANYTTSNQNTITIAPFSLTFDGSTYNFEGATLPHIGEGTFSGIIDVSNPPAAQLPDSAFFVLNITDSTDADNDGIPDIVDTDIVITPTECDLFETLFTGEVFVALEDGFFFNFADAGYYYGGYCPFLYEFTAGSWWYVYEESTDPVGFFAYDFAAGKWYFIFYGYKMDL